jgi:Ca2+-binding RTX toxin-like protein
MPKKIYINGNNGSDIYFGNDNYTVVHTYGGPDSIVITGTNSSIYAGSGDDSIHITGKSSLIYGDAGTDYVLAELGKNTVYGGEGNDFLNVTNAGNYVSGGKGDDYISVYNGFDWDGNGRNVAYGDSGDDYILLSSDKSSVFGGEGNDTLEASYASNDSISAGQGNDTFLLSNVNHVTVSGGSGSDNFIFRTYIPVDVTPTSDDEIITLPVDPRDHSFDVIITDFTKGYDTVSLSDFNIHFSELTIEDGAAGDRVRLMGLEGDTILDFTFKGVHNIEQSDFAGLLPDFTHM